jgi:hypothetical protein
MALDYTIVKNSTKETVVQVNGANDSLGIALTSLASSDEVLGATGASGATGPVANLSAVISSGNLGSSVVIRRGATGATGNLVFAGSPENSPIIQFNQYGFTANAQNNKDVSISHGGATGANVTTWLVFHKQEGYYDKVEYEKYGEYDDETKVGAQNISGSPGASGATDPY